MGNIFLSVVIPAYNEEKNISSTLSDVSGYLSAKGISYEVVVVDDGSKDRTLEEAAKHKNNIRSLQIIESVPNKGKGYVLRKGMLAALGEYVMFMDADNATSIKQLERFIPLMEKKDADVLIASRRVKGAAVHVPLIRRIMGNVYILFAKIVLGIKVNDINCGFKVFKRSAARNVFSRQIMDDWSFDAEIMYLCEKFGYTIKEIPVKWDHKDTSKVVLFSDSVKSFMSLVKIRMNILCGVYGK